MFNRIALMWVWALILLAGILFPPDTISSNPKREEAWMILLGLMFLYQCIFVFVMTRQEYWRLRNEHEELRNRAYDLEEAALREAAGYE